jgi:hypothetical protein
MIRLLALHCALLAGLACTGAVPDPEAEIEALLDELERASRERDIAALKDRVSERYADPEGRGKAELDALIGAHYLRGGTVYLLLHLRSLETVADDSSARASVLAGMARVPLEDWSRLRATRGDAYVFELELAREGGDWRVTRASWEPATLDDLLPGV